jgi:PAS domain S-box-containing protein
MTSESRVFCMSASAHLPKNGATLAYLQDAGVLDLSKDERFERIARLASLTCQAPIALVTLVNGQTLVFKSHVGLSQMDIPMEITFCGYTLLQGDTLVILDALADERFAHNPLVTGQPFLRFYAGHPLRTASGERFGTLCVLDRKPRESFDAIQREALRDLARLAEQEFRLLEIQRVAIEPLMSVEKQAAAGLGAGGSLDPLSFRQAWRRLGLLYDVSQVFATGTDTSDVALQVLRTFGKSERAAYAALWLGHEDTLQLESSWSANDARYEPFKASREAHRFPMGRGLLGRVWHVGRPEWVMDIASRAAFEDREQASRAGLHTALFFPLWGSRRVIGVLELYLPEVLAPDDGLLQVGSSIAGQLAQFFERAREQQRIRTLEERNRKGEALLEEAQAAAHVGSWELDFESGTVRFSDELRRIYGLAPTQAITPKLFFDLVHPDDRAQVRQLVARVRADRQPFELEHRIIRADGAIRVIHGRGMVLAALLDRPERAVGTALDITDLKAALEAAARHKAVADQLHELDQLKANFVNAISHDLRSPLTTIIGYTELLEDTLAGTPDARQTEYIEQIELAAERMGRLIGDMLDYARLQAGFFTLKRAATDLSAAVARATQSQSPQALQRGVKLTLALPKGPVCLEVDAQRIEQVVTNLVSNAIKFSPKGGQIEVHLFRDALGLCCEVRDEGPGIAPEDIPHLFRLFSQLSAGERSGGTGLGLFISKKLIEAHGGTIGVTSEPDHGATFWFRLPEAA